MKRLLRRYREEKGATLLEFAMVAPVLIYFILVIIELGVIMTTQSILEGSISQAARKHRALARSNSPGAAIAVVEQYIVDMGAGLIKRDKLDVSMLEIDIKGAAVSEGAEEAQYTGSTDEIYRYTATYNYELMVPQLEYFFSDKDEDDTGIIHLKASTAVHNEPSIGGGVL